MLSLSILGIGIYTNKHIEEIYMNGMRDGYLKGMIDAGLKRQPDPELCHPPCECLIHYDWNKILGEGVVG